MRVKVMTYNASPELRVERSAIVRSEEADRASDHYPVVAELSLDLTAAAAGPGCPR